MARLIMLLIEELKSCFKNEKLLLSIAISLIFLFASQYQSYSSQENTPYDQVIKSLAINDVPENIRLLTNKIEELTVLVRFSNNEISQEELNEFDEVESIIQNYRDGETTLFTGNPYDELKLYRSILDANVAIRDYPINLMDKIDQLEKKIKSPLFQNLSDIDSLKTELVMLNQLTQLNPSFFVNQSSVERFLNNNISTYLLVFNMIIVLSVILLEDKKYQLNALFKTTRYGRTKHFLSKIAVICISGFILALLFYGIELLFAVLNNLPLSIPVQSVNGFIDVYYPYSIYMYWLVTLSFKLLIVFTLILFIFSLFILIDNTMVAYGLIGLFTLIQYLLSILISPNSKFITLKQLSIFTIIDIKKVFAQIEFISIGNFGIFYPTFLLILMITIISVCFGLSWHGFIRIGNQNIKWNSPIQNIMKGSKNLFFLETHKVFIMNKGIFLFVLLILFQIMYFSSYNGPTQLDAYNYSSYIEPFVGPVSEDVLKNIENEPKRFESLRETQTKLIEQRNNHDIDENIFLAKYFEAQYELNDESHYQTLNEKFPIMLKYGYIFDTTGYEHYFSISSETLALIYHILSIIIIVIISIILASTEIINHTKNLILSTLRRRNYVLNVLLILMLSIVIVLGITYFPQFIIMNQYLKLMDFRAPLQAVFENAIPLNIGSTYLILLMNKAMVLGLYGGISILLTKYFDRNIVMFLMLSVIGFDVLMYYFGIKIFSLFYLSNIYVFFNSSMILISSILIVIALFLFTYLNVYKYISSFSN